MEETKINYQKEQERLLKNLVNAGEKPTLLLHVCCGPCFTYPFELIKDYFKNPRILKLLNLTMIMQPTTKI